MIPVVRQRGTVAELHQLDPFGSERVEPAVWWCDPIDDAIVLGSRQSEALLDRAACERAGLHIANRRSGGGAVIVRRRRVHWIDIVVPPDVLPDDVRGSMVWIGERWRAVLESHTTQDLRVHRGGLQTSEWSQLVCFAGVGPGEVVADAGKLVGLSQRRTRWGIRVQGLVHTGTVADEYRALLTGPLPSGAPPREATLEGLDGESLASALAIRITSV